MDLIPTINTSNSTFSVVLNNVGYNMRTYWQEEATMWFLDLSLNDDTPVAMGLALVPNINILRFSRTLTRTIGELRVVGIDGDQNNRTDSLGNTSQLIYFLPGEFDTLFPDYESQDFRTQQFDFDELFTVAP